MSRALQVALWALTIALAYGAIWSALDHAGECFKLFYPSDAAGRLGGDEHRRVCIEGTDRRTLLLSAASAVLLVASIGYREFWGD